jgi:predicted DNA-binding protein
MAPRKAIITRIPVELHDRLVAVADLHGVSMNTYVQALIEQEVHREIADPDPLRSPLRPDHAVADR